MFHTNEDGSREIGAWGWVLIVVLCFVLPPVGIIGFVWAVWWKALGEEPDHIVRRSYTTTAGLSEMAHIKARREAAARRKEAETDDSLR